MFISEPTQYCSGKEPSVNDAIKISWLFPTNKQTLAKKTSVMYGITSPVAIRKVILALDGKTFTSFLENSVEVFGRKSVDLSAFSDGSHSLSITVIDANNGTKTETVGVNLVSTDTQAPLLLRDKSSVTKNEDGSYQVNFVFQDELSSVKDGKIFEKGSASPLVTF